MVIRLQCPCGKRLAVKREMAGRRGKCPHCAKTFVIPRPTQQESSPQDREPLPEPENEQPAQAPARLEKCASCGADRPADKIVCPSCSYSKRLGKRMNTRSTYLPAPAARKSRSAPTAHASSPSGSSVGWNWQAGVAIAGAVALGLLVLLFVISPGIAIGLFLLSLLLVHLVATLTVVVSHICILVRAAGESLGELALCLFVPCYIIYYVISRWDEAPLLGRIYFGSYGVHVAIYMLFMTISCLVDLNAN